MNADIIKSIYDYNNGVEDDVASFNEISENLVAKYMKDLDDEMNEIYNVVVLQDYPSVDDLEKHFLKLSSLIYFTTEKVEHAGIYDDVSKAKAKEAYNNSYLNGVDTATGKKPTAAELTAMAENATMTESITNQIYSKSYKLFKNKLDAAQTMVSTLSKVISKRMQEAQFSITNEQTTSRKILNEAFEPVSSDLIPFN